MLNADLGVVSVMMQTLLLLLGVRVQLAFSAQDPCPSCTKPIAVKFGFSTQGVYAEKPYRRDPQSAQHIAALMLAKSDIKNYASSSDGGIIDLQLLSYQGNQISDNSGQQNDFFDGAFGAFTIGPEVVGNIASDTSLFRSKSMTSCFNGWGIATLLVGQLDTSFSHGNDYPLKARLVPSDNLLAIPLVSILLSYKWTRVALISSTDQIGIDLHKNFLRTLGTTTLTGSEHSGVSLLADIAVSPSTTDFSEIINKLKETGATIFVFLFNYKMQALLLTQGVDRGLFILGTQTIGVCISADDPDEGGKSISQYLTDSGSAAKILKGHITLKFDPRILFKTKAGRSFVSRLKKLSPTRKQSSSGFAPKLNSYLYQLPGWPSGSRWFADECKVWDESSGNYFKDAYDDGRGKNVTYVGLQPQPGNPGWLYASIDASATGSVFSINAKEQYKNQISFDDLSDLKNSTLGMFTHAISSKKYYWSDANKFTPCGSLQQCLSMPLWGTCLGLSQEELNSIADDGSSNIDWRSMYIYDALWVVYTNAMRFYRSGVSFNDKDDFTSKLRDYFNTVIPSNIKEGRQVSTPQPSVLTGDVSFHAGFPLDDHFMQGDRISGFPFTTNQYFADSNSFRPIGFWDPQEEVYKFCQLDGTVQMLSISGGLNCRQPEFRTADSVTRPDSMKPTLVISLPSTYKVAMQFFGSMALITTVVLLAMVNAKRKHQILKMRQPSILFVFLFGNLLGSIKVFLGSSWVISESMCNANYWLEHLSFRIVCTSLLFKLWRIDKIFNASGFKRVRISENTILTNVLIAFSSCVVVLILSSALAGSRLMQSVEIVQNQVRIINFCGIPSSLPSLVLHAILLIFQSIGLLGALFYAWKTKNVPPIVNEAPIIIPQLFFVFVIVVTAGSLLLSFNPNPFEYQLVINLLFALVIFVSNIWYFLPIFRAIFLHDKKDSSLPQKSRLSIMSPSEKPNETLTGFSTSETLNTNSREDHASAKTGRSSLGGSINGSTRHNSNIPLNVDVNELYEDVVRELLRGAESSDKKAIICQEKIVFWKSMMLQIEEMAEMSNSGQDKTSVYIEPDDN